jgi:hypothetical protein
MDTISVNPNNISYVAVEQWNQCTSEYKRWLNGNRAYWLGNGKRFFDVFDTEQKAKEHINDWLSKDCESRINCITKEDELIQWEDLCNDEHYLSTLGLELGCIFEDWFNKLYPEGEGYYDCASNSFVGGLDDDHFNLGDYQYKIETITYDEYQQILEDQTV